MFEIKYPGHCFGNLDTTSKECKKCRLSQHCKNKGTPYSSDAGAMAFKEGLESVFNCSVSEQNESLELKCFLKDTGELAFTAVFSEDGKIKMGNGKEFLHIPSKEIAGKIIEEIINDYKGNRDISSGM